MNLLTITPQNIETEHICCAISNSADVRKCAQAKKQWMLDAMKDEYHFCRPDLRGKVFIETIPAKHAWAPIEADGWLFIDCFWVSGQYKGKGIANQLLEHAIQQATQDGYLGLVAISAVKKQPFLSDPSYYKYKGFVVADTAEPYFTLLALPLSSSSSLPKFQPHVHHPSVPDDGISIFYSDHCPHTSKYVPLLQQAAKEEGVLSHVRKFETKQAAQKSPAIFTSYSFYYNGEFITNEIFSSPKLKKFLQENN